jgi:glycosyltransferase involved in cell wall biosynthesis
MKIFVVSFCFPPYNTIGAVRVSKIAKYLMLAGHKVRVVTARDQPAGQSLPVEVPGEQVQYTSWINVNAPVEKILGGRKRIASRGFEVSSTAGGKALSSLGELYKTLVHIPDAQVGWGTFAYRAAVQMIGRSPPDLLFASGPPWTSLVVAGRLSRHYRIPWIADLRDLWAGTSYGAGPAWRRVIDRKLEGRVLSTAAGLVTVSDPLAAILRARYGLPVQVVTNGCDLADYPPTVDRGDGTLEIVYTGMVYPGKRDPTPLFLALQRLGEAGSRIRVRFFGRYLESVRASAMALGVSDHVEISDSIGYTDSLRMQVNADVLLLLLGEGSEEAGVYSGKLFEYIGARREILLVGPRNSVASSLIERFGLGVVTKDPAQIADYLVECLERKSRGRLPSIDSMAAELYSRESQTNILIDFMREVLQGGSR